MTWPTPRTSYGETLDALVLKALSLEPLHGWGISDRIRQLSRDAFLDRARLALPRSAPLRAGWLVTSQSTLRRREATYLAQIRRAPTAASAGWAAAKGFQRSTVTRAGPNDAGRNRQLPDMTHGMFCTMNEASNDGRRQLRPPHTAEVAKCPDIDGLQLRQRRINPVG